MVGVLRWDRQQLFYSVNNPLILVGNMSLRHVLYHYMKLAEGYYLIAEVYQESGLDSVDIFIPETPKAEAMVDIMNKQISVYLSNYLVDASMVNVFLKALIQGDICLDLNRTASTCTWDINKKTVTTPEDSEQERQKVLEYAACYKD